MTLILIYVIAGIGVLISLAALGIYIHRAAKAVGRLEMSNACDKRIHELKTKWIKNSYNSIDNINAGMDIRLSDPTVRIKDTKTPI